MASDLYSALIGAPTGPLDKQAAIAEMLRRKAGFAGVAQLSGDPVLSRMGADMSGQVRDQSQQLQSAQQTAQDQARMQANSARQFELTESAQALTKRGQDLDAQSALQNTMARLAELEASKTKKAGTVQEGERKSAALGTRLEGALRELEGLGADASKPGFFEKAFEGLGSEMSANAVRGPKRQRANAAQLDALDAALTLATGAAYTKEQLANLRQSYFPQLMDDEETIKAKEQRFKTIVETARIAAGRAEPAIDTALGGERPAPVPTAGKGRMTPQQRARLAELKAKRDQSGT